MSLKPETWYIKAWNTNQKWTFLNRIEVFVSATFSMPWQSVLGLSSWGTLCREVTTSVVDTNLGCFAVSLNCRDTIDPRNTIMYYHVLSTSIYHTWHLTWKGAWRLTFDVLAPRWMTWTTKNPWFFSTNEATATWPAATRAIGTAHKAQLVAILRTNDLSQRKKDATYFWICLKRYVGWIGLVPLKNWWMDGNGWDIELFKMWSHTSIVS